MGASSAACAPCFITILPKVRLPKGPHSLPSSCKKKRASFRITTQGWHPFLGFGAVARFPGLRGSFGHVNRNLSRKALQSSAHVAMATHKATVPSKAFLPSLSMLVSAGMGGKCPVPPDFSSTHLVGVSLFLPFSPTQISALT